MKRFKRWIARNFRVITIAEAQELGLGFHHNVHGDMINLIGCRSLWIDEKGRPYRIGELVK